MEARDYASSTLGGQAVGGDAYRNVAAATEAPMHGQMLDTLDNLIDRLQAVAEAQAQLINRLGINDEPPPAPATPCGPPSAAGSVGALFMRLDQLGNTTNRLSNQQRMLSRLS